MKEFTAEGYQTLKREIQTEVYFRINNGSINPWALKLTHKNDLLSWYDKYYNGELYDDEDFMYPDTTTQEGIVWDFFCNLEAEIEMQLEQKQNI